MSQHPNKSDYLTAGLKKVLNTHGYGFQYAVLRRTEQLFSNGQTDWVFEASEFPVITKNQNTHVDFILRSKSKQTFLVAECKRVDPAKGCWGFVPVPYTWRNPKSNQVIFEQFRYVSRDIVIPTPLFHDTQQETYHLGLELRTNNPGDGISGGRAINDAVSQVLRGVSGLINHLFHLSNRSYSKERIFRFVPAIFTTARILVADIDLGTADLVTGDLPNALQTKEVDWLWFNHNRSPDLRHNLESVRSGDELSEELKSDFARSIAIVGPGGVDNFLKMNLEKWLD